MCKAQVYHATEEPKWEPPGTRGEAERNKTPAGRQTLFSGVGRVSTGEGAGKLRMEWLGDSCASSLLLFLSSVLEDGN